MTKQPSKQVEAIAPVFPYSQASVQESMPQTSCVDNALLHFVTFCYTKGHCQQCHCRFPMFPRPVTNLPAHGNGIMLQMKRGLSGHHRLAEKRPCPLHHRLAEKRPCPLQFASMDVNPGNTTMATFCMSRSTNKTPR